jgi:hypothetical protein
MISKKVNIFFTKITLNIDEICKKYGIINYTINQDDSIDVDGYVDLRNYKLTELPLKFNKVSGRFNCSYNKLTSLEGCPNYVGDTFYCSYNDLTSLESAPNYVGGKFYCYGNPLPQEIIDNPKAEIIRLNREKKLNILLDEY